MVLGNKLAGKLDAKIGDSIDASFPEANPATLKVAGIYDSSTPRDEKLVYARPQSAHHISHQRRVVYMRPRTHPSSMGGGGMILQMLRNKCSDVEISNQY